MKTLKKNYVLNSIISSKICVGSSISDIDPTHFSALLGHRKSLFSILNPFLVQHSLKTAFLFLESLVKNNYHLFLIIDTNDFTFFQKFDKVCRNKNHSLLRASEISSGFLTNKNVTNIVIITLFLEQRKSELIQKESIIMKVPIISFSDLASNKFSSSVYAFGNFNSFFSQNLILSLISICLDQNNGTS